jgi:hypothetical protein
MVTRDEIAWTGYFVKRLGLGIQISRLRFHLVRELGT